MRAFFQESQADRLEKSIAIIILGAIKKLTTKYTTPMAGGKRNTKERKEEGQIQPEINADEQRFIDKTESGR